MSHGAAELSISAPAAATRSTAKGMADGRVAADPAGPVLAPDDVGPDAGRVEVLLDRLTHLLGETLLLLGASSEDLNGPGEL